MKYSSILLICVLFAVFLAACSVDQTGRAPSNVSPSPLPNEAYKASISITKPPPQTLLVGGQTTLEVKVKNMGNGTWPALVPGAKYRVDLGNHWLDKNGAAVVYDDGRADLPHDLKPGEEAVVFLTAKAPKTPGDYILELDMVHEALAWFKNHGSQTTQVNITVK